MLPVSEIAGIHPRDYGVGSGVGFVLNTAEIHFKYRYIYVYKTTLSLFFFFFVCRGTNLKALSVSCDS